jgi:ubiquinone/menaquinone biosynthesis C-methylase UbiE
VMRRLNWGSSFHTAPGWINSDRHPHGQEHVGDLLAGLPFPDDYFDYAVTHHALQMFDYVELPDALRELKRVLKPGAPLRISVPDPLRAFRAWQHVDAAALIIPDEIEPTLGGKFSAYITWYGTNKTLFTPEFLIDLFERNGWSRVVEVTFGATVSETLAICDLDDKPDRRDESLYFEAYK